MCIVSSLQDGMNLVAKEYVASQVDRNGVLLLSEFAGAAEAMPDATLINPYDPEGCALRIRDALTLPAPERAAGMERLAASLNTIYDWLHDVFTAWGGVARGNALPRGAPSAADGLDPLDPDDEPFTGGPFAGTGLAGPPGE